MVYFFFFGVFLSGRWVSADPAALLEFFPVLPLLRTLEAALPALLLVFSFWAIRPPLTDGGGGLGNF